ncbi:cutinase family protein [Candidatus Saccharibacteria bacterium]|nr:cutinase family protein [Candidatus Saccharibacteria bacterium]
MKISYYKIFLCGIIAFTPLISFTPSNAYVFSCDDVRFIFARGSGSSLGADDESAWRTSLDKMFRGTKLKYGFYELGATEQNGHKYPAAAVNGSASGFLNLIGAAIGGGDSFTYGDSVDEGVAELQNYIEKTSKACPYTKFVVGGYSQGAQVVSKAISKSLIPADNLIYAATFGDPKIYLPEGIPRQGTVPEACLGQNLSNYRVYAPNCRDYDGILGSHRPYEPHQYHDKVGVWCHNDDIMCSMKSNLDDHLSYVSDNLYLHASYIIANKVAEAFPAETISGASTNIKTNQDTVIMFDTTDSMASMIDSYKEEALKLARETFAKGGHVALVEYRDLHDPFIPVVHCNLDTCTLHDFEYKLAGLQAYGGGDSPESYLSCVYYALNHLNWHQGANKTIIGISDAGFHDPDRNGVTKEMVIARTLEIDPVNLYVITPETGEYTEITTATNGAVFSSADEYSTSTQYILERPIAILKNASYYGLAGDTLTFDASSSTASTTINHYEWDLDFDGEFETSSTNPIITHTYSSPISGIMQVKVVDNQGYSSTMSANVVIAENPEAPATISDIVAEPTDDNTYRVKFTTQNTEKTLVSLNDTILGFTNENDLTISNIEYLSELTLIPYSNSDTRGTSNTINLGVSPRPAKINFSSLNIDPNLSDTNISITGSTSIVRAPNSGKK